jgi:hypothetical protein
MMIGRGTPISHSNAPLPQVMLFSCRFSRRRHNEWDGQGFRAVLIGGCAVCPRLTYRAQRD